MTKEHKNDLSEIPEWVREECDAYLREDTLYASYDIDGEWNGRTVLIFDTKEEVCIGLPLFYMFDEKHGGFLDPDDTLLYLAHKNPELAENC